MTAFSTTRLPRCSRQRLSSPMGVGALLTWSAVPGFDGRLTLALAACSSGVAWCPHPQPELSFTAASNALLKADMRGPPLYSPPLLHDVYQRRSRGHVPHHKLVFAGESRTLPDTHAFTASSSQSRQCTISGRDALNSRSVR